MDVVDAANLERNLYLAVQLMEMGVKVVLALNMIDVADGRGRKDRSRKTLSAVERAYCSHKRQEGKRVDRLLEAALREAEKDSEEKDLPVITYGHDVENELVKIREALEATAIPGSVRPSIACRQASGRRSRGGETGKGNPRDQRRLGSGGEKQKSSHEMVGNSPQIAVADGRYGFIRRRVEGINDH